MRLALRIPISLVAGILSAGLGWLVAALVGTLMPLEGLGFGILMALLLYVLAFMFGVTGFVLCMVLLSKRRLTIPK